MIRETVRLDMTIAVDWDVKPQTNQTNITLFLGLCFRASRCGPPDTSALLKIIFLISHSKHMLWVLKRKVRRDRSFEHRKQMLEIV